MLAHNLKASFWTIFINTAFMIISPYSYVQLLIFSCALYKQVQAMCCFRVSWRYNFTKDDGFIYTLWLERYTHKLRIPIVKYYANSIFIHFIYLDVQFFIKLRLFQLMIDHVPSTKSIHRVLNQPPLVFIFPAYCTFNFVIHYGLTYFPTTAEFNIY